MLPARFERAMSVCKTDAFGHLATRANWCATVDEDGHYCFAVALSLLREMGEAELGALVSELRAESLAA